MGKPLLGLILITWIRASHGSCNHPDGLSSRKRKSAQSVIIGINKSGKSSKSVVLLLASVFCLRQTQVFTSEPLFFSIFICFFIFFLRRQRRNLLYGIHADLQMSWIKRPARVNPKMAVVCAMVPLIWALEVHHS